METSSWCDKEEAWLDDDFRWFFLNRDRGVYVLFLKLAGKQVITVGRLSDIHFPRGYYAYVGSAMNGLKSRLSRHLRRDKKLHWHIDYLLEKASIVDISIARTEDRAECIVAQALGSQFDFIPGFGSSDCRCLSHLFFATEEKKMKVAVGATIEGLDMLPAVSCDRVGR